MSAPLALAAPAKLNLWLSVVGRRPDGHHELVSGFVLLELADRLLLMAGSSGLRVEPPDADVPLDGSNLAWRGLLAGVGREPELACLTVEKRIPAAAGLGGGSSDAAAAWRLGRRWAGLDDRPSPHALELLSRIGADVPFFAAQLPAATVTGIGERIEAADALPEREVVLAIPPFGLSTAAVFAELRPAEWSRRPVADGNDLLAPALRLRPELGAIFETVRAAGGRPRLTGSGPTVFTLSDDPEQADATARAIERAGLRAIRTRLAERATRIAAMDEADRDIP